MQAERGLFYFAVSAASTFGGDIGRSVRRLPIALWMALAIAAIGGTILAFHAVGVVRVRHFDQHAFDRHHQIGCDWHPVIEKTRIAQVAVLVVDVFLVERPADALHDAAMDLAFDVGRMYRAANVLRADPAQNLYRTCIRIDLDVAELRRKSRRLAAVVDAC